MALPDYPAPAQSRDDVRAWVGEIAKIVRNMRRGAMNVVGEITLTADGELTQTTKIDDRCHKYSSIALDPLSAAAAALKATGEVYVAAANRSEGQFIVNHPPIEEGEVVAFYYTIQG